MTIHAFPKLPMTEREARQLLTSADAGQSSQLRRLAWATLRALRAGGAAGTGWAGRLADLSVSCGTGAPHPADHLTGGPATTHATGPARPFLETR